MRRIYSLIVVSIAWMTGCNTAEDTIVPVFGCGEITTEGKMYDCRDSMLYDVVAIGNQLWMAENLNYSAEEMNESHCYGNRESNCKIFGRLYSWNYATGTQLGDIVESDTIKGICPEGWRLPNNNDWNTLAEFIAEHTMEVNGDVQIMYGVGRHLKSTTGWNGTEMGDTNGLNSYGFNALPGGRYLNGRFSGVNEQGNWWSATQLDGGISFYWNLEYVHFEDFNVSQGYAYTELSVRCIQQQS